ncbi:toll/interleukin-1 receptor domain-containing protein [Flexithrix dorotheae]|uniref:toll/interleukin-1 receptor domain-containing protein n=1 Tax=Flexithrix dorotheae TaxID=70993 RepID=UPI00037B7539|nr:toll/interleukin-1 receptor domain-containing protein [Flexithrix dorotheae]
MKKSFNTPQDLLSWLLEIYAEKGENEETTLMVNLVESFADTTAASVKISKLTQEGFITSRVRMDSGVMYYEVGLLDKALALAKPKSEGKKVFISYNHQDKAMAGKVKEKLEDAGIEVTIDSEAMHAGEDIKSFIEKCVRENDITLSLISSNSLLSAWVAMESMLTFSGEKTSHKKFIPCAIDQSFFGRSFVDDALDYIEEEIVEIDKVIQKRMAKNRGFEDLQNERTRYNQLQHNLPEIIRKLKESLTVDISERNFDSGLEKVIKTILS